MVPRYVFPIRDIENGMLEIHEQLPSAWLTDVLGDTGVTAAPNEVGEFDASLTMSGKDVVVCGSVRASVKLACARCTQDTTVPVVAKLALLLVPGKASPMPKVDGADVKKKSKRRKKQKGDDDGHLIAPEEAELDTYVRDEVVLDGFLREAILLELPIFPLCSEKCPGIGAAASVTAETASAEPAIDPRLAPLLELKKKNE